MATDDERDAALGAVRAAAALCTAAQGRLAAGETLTKGDDSPVTVADFAAQAVVAEVLLDRLGDIELVGEESPSDLADDSVASLRDGVLALVRDHHRPDADAADVLRWVGAGSSDGSSDRFWTLDPIDGTKGFLRGDQFAIALALIEQGEVTFGVLGCPNLPTPDGGRGAIFVSDRSRCVAWYGSASDPVETTVARPATMADARICESVEAAHSSHDDAARVAELLGITSEPYRIDSQCKYAAVARGDADIYLRLPTRPGYREKIWDHAAGMLVVEGAGGRVTDVDGRRLDFSHGRRLEHNRGVIATEGHHHDEVVAAVATVLGEPS